MPQQQPGPAGGGPWPNDDQWQWAERPERRTALSPGWPPVPQPELPGGPWPRRGPQPLTVALLAVLAALAAAIVALILLPGSASPSRSPVNVSAGAGGNHLFTRGTVTRISSSSVTLGAQGHSVTAAINSGTQFTGTAQDARAIKPGDAVTVLISGYGSADPVVQSISDPPAAP